ncbi:tRNA dimethylallyltransferase [compost metagenome]
MTTHLASQKKESPYELCIIGLTMDRALLYHRIEQRIDAMIQEGLVEEVQSLLDAGTPTSAISMQALGYKEIVSYLEHELTFEAAVTLLKRDTRRFAKRQLSWFRHMKDINWVDVTDTANFSAHFEMINDILAGKFVHKIEYN